MEEDQPKKKRISTGVAIAMVLVALLLDTISLIPVVGSFISAIFGFGIFGFWFYKLGVPLISPKKLASWGLNFLAEIFPGVGSVWVGVTCGVILMIGITWAEDKTGVQIANKLPVGKNLSVKQARRAANPTRALEAERRLERMRRGRQLRENGIPDISPGKERPRLNDINYPNAA